MTREQLRHLRGIEYADKLGLTVLREWHKSRLQKLSEKEVFVPLEIPVRKKPKITLIYPDGWCGQRHFEDLAKYIKQDYDVNLSSLDDLSKIKLDSDLYIIRGVWPIIRYESLKAVSGNIVAILESERELINQRFPFFKLVRGIIPLCESLKQESINYANYTHDIIPNGINVDEFTPAESFPEEFTVGACGNFSTPSLDEWKGFSKYIVPACKLAKVKLKWCGWKSRNGNGTMAAPHVELHRMPEFYRSVSCLVSMSKSEACSSVTFEAMASGLPVLSTKTGWHGDNCNLIWIPRAKKESEWKIKLTIWYLALVLFILKHNKKLCERIGKRNREVAERYSWKNTSSLWKAAITHFLRMAK